MYKKRHDILRKKCKKLRKSNPLQLQHNKRTKQLNTNLGLLKMPDPAQAATRHNILDKQDPSCHTSIAESIAVPFTTLSAHLTKAQSKRKKKTII